MACQSVVCTRTSERTKGTFSDAWGIYRIIQNANFNIICKCVESVVRQPKEHSKISLCSHNPWPSSPGLRCWTYWPTFQ